MYEEFSYPLTWKAESNIDASSLVLTMHKIAIQAGFRVSILNAENPSAVGWDRMLQFQGVRIIFIDQEYGCTLVVEIINEVEIKKAFFTLWKFFVDKDYFWGGPYIKEISKVEEETKSELLPVENEKEQQEIKRRNGIVKHWLMRGDSMGGKMTLPEYLEEHQNTFPTEKEFYEQAKKMYKAGIIGKKGRQYCLLNKD